MTLQVGWLYRMRCGEVIVIEGVSGDLFFAVYRKIIKVYWKQNGRRIPGGGEDPLDIISKREENTANWIGLDGKS